MEGDYHLIYTWQTGQLRLYDIRRDIGEQHDLAAAEPARVRRMAPPPFGRLREAGAQRPAFRATRLPARGPTRRPRPTDKP